MMLCPSVHGLASGPSIRLLQYFMFARGVGESHRRLDTWQVLEDGRQWWKLRNRSGQAGYVPCNILAEARQEDVGAPLEQVIACHGSILSTAQSEPLRSGVQLVSM